MVIILPLKRQGWDGAKKHKDGLLVVDLIGRAESEWEQMKMPAVQSSRQASGYGRQAFMLDREKEVKTL